MEFNCEGQNGGENGGFMMYNDGLDHIDLCAQFLVLTRRTHGSQSEQLYSRVEPKEL